MADVCKGAIAGKTAWQWENEDHLETGHIFAVACYPAFVLTVEFLAAMVLR